MSQYTNTCKMFTLSKIILFLITRSGTDYDVFALILNCLHETDQGGTNIVIFAMWRQNESAIVLFFLITRSGTCYDVIALILIDCLHVSDQGGTNNVGLQCEGKIIVHFERPNVQWL